MDAAVDVLAAIAALNDNDNASPTPSVLRPRGLAHQQDQHTDEDEPQARILREASSGAVLIVAWWWCCGL